MSDNVFGDVTTPIVNKLLNTSMDMTDIALEHIANIGIKDALRLPLPIEGLVDAFVPMTAGDTCVVSGQTHQGKTLLMFEWCIEAAKLLDQSNNEKIVFVDLENFQEQLSMKLLRRTIKGIPTEKELINRATFGEPYEVPEDAVRRAFNEVIPGLITLSPRMEDAQLFNQMTVSNIWAWLDELRNGKIFDYKVKIAGVFIDYLGALPTDIPLCRSLHVDLNNVTRVTKAHFDHLYLMAGGLKTAVIVGVQSPKVPSKNGNLYMPSPYDSADSSDVGRRTDRYIGVTVPAQYWKDEAPIKFFQPDEGEMQITVHRGLQIVGIQKQRVDGGQDSTGKLICLNWTDHGPKQVFAKQVAGMIAGKGKF